MGREEPGLVIIATGPHGAGKDTLKNALLKGDRPVGNIVRHTTRRAAPDERPDHDYYFVTSARFRAIAGVGGFAQYSNYPEAMTGTTWDEVRTSISRFRVSLTTMNFEDAVELRSTLRASGVVCAIVFVGPVAFAEFKTNKDTYLYELEHRMTLRNRATDDISLRLTKASQYREQFLQASNDIHYVANTRDQPVESASRELLMIADSCSS